MYDSNVESVHMVVVKSWYPPPSGPKIGEDIRVSRPTLQIDIN